MNSNQIRHVLHHGKIGQFHTGVYACDQLHHVNSDQFAIVVNTDDSNHKGMHWLAIFKKRFCEVEFFDSFAMPISFYSPFIKSFVKRFSKRFLHNNIQLQSNYSNMCGQFCCFYILHRMRGWSLDSIINDFSFTNLARNDEKVYQFVQSNFHTQYTSHKTYKNESEKLDVLCISQCCKSFKSMCTC